MIFREEVIRKYLNKKGVYPTDIKLYSFNEKCVNYTYTENNDRYFNSISKRIYLIYFRKYRLDGLLYLENGNR